jgi:hypothetical protein
LTPRLKALTFIKTDLGYKLELNRLLEKLSERLDKICLSKKVVLELDLHGEIDLSYDIETPLYHILLQMINYAGIFFAGQRMKIMTQKERYPMVQIEVCPNGLVAANKLLQGFYNNLRFGGLDIRVYSNMGMLTFSFVFTPPTQLLSQDL